jgi:hypothetical protein
MILLTACGKEKTEQEKYLDLQASLKYKAYKAITSNALPPALKLYNQQRQASLPKVDESMVRLLLGYGWSISQKPALAMVEGKLVTASDTDAENYRLLGHSVIAIAMYEKGWKQIARTESSKAVDILKKESGRKNARETLMVAHLLLGTVSIYEKNYKAARFHFAGFSAVTKIDWPYTAVDALADIAEGQVQQGLTKLKKMTRDENLPPEVRKAIAEGITIIENEAGPVDSRLFWPRLISRLAYKELKRVANPAINSLMKVVNEIGSKVGLNGGSAS